MSIDFHFDCSVPSAPPVPPVPTARLPEAFADAPVAKSLKLDGTYKVSSNQVVRMRAECKDNKNGTTQYQKEEFVKGPGTIKYPKSSFVSGPSGTEFTCAMKVAPLSTKSITWTNNELKKVVSSYNSAMKK